MKNFKKTRYNALTISGRGVVTEFYQVIEEKKDYFKVCLTETNGDLGLCKYVSIIWKKQIGKKNHDWSIEIID
tara:strand:- start:26 stop:244 length:219 start_codon:yes stop_codon:yes gene_type:complete